MSGFLNSWTDVFVVVVVSAETVVFVVKLLFCFCRN